MIKHCNHCVERIRGSGAAFSKVPRKILGKLLILLLLLLLLLYRVSYYFAEQNW